MKKFLLLPFVVLFSLSLSSCSNVDMQPLPTYTTEQEEFIFQDLNFYNDKETGKVYVSYNENSDWSKFVQNLYFIIPESNTITALPYKIYNSINEYTLEDLQYLKEIFHKYENHIVNPVRDCVASFGYMYEYAENRCPYATITYNDREEPRPYKKDWWQKYFSRPDFNTTVKWYLDHSKWFCAAAISKELTLDYFSDLSFKSLDSNDLYSDDYTIRMQLQNSALEFICPQAKPFVYSLFSKGK